MMAVSKIVNGYSHSLAQAKVKEIKLTLSYITCENVQASSIVKAALKCLHSDWCTVVCELSSGQFSLCNFIATGGGASDQNGDGSLLTCYTKRQRGYSLLPSAGVTLSSSQHMAEAPGKILSNLNDGLYFYDHADCFMSSSGDETLHVLVDLGEVKRIRKVVYITQPDGFLHNAGRDTEVRVSNVTDIDFTDYTFFDNEVNVVREFKKEIVFESRKVIFARYVVIFVIEPTDLFQFCHLEIL